MTKTTRCVICDSEFSKVEIKNATCCPECGAKGVPCAIKDDVTIKVNWHELRILGCWAERWAMRIEKENLSSVATVGCIVARLQKQYPNKTPLTITGEVEQLKSEFPDVTGPSPSGK